MKNFTRQESWLSKSSFEIRLIYTLFIVFALAGHLSFILISLSRIGPTYGKIVAHYRGGGEVGEEMSFPKEFPELLEVTHFHAYIEGIVLLVLAHLFAGVPLPRGIKLGIIGLSFGSTFLDLASPWLIRYLSPQAAYAQMAAWIGMGVSYLPLTLLPIYFLWKSVPEGRRKKGHGSASSAH
ncbi:MAG: hypothetical protein LLH30_03590 [Candidatus Manganitrophus sp. SA1]|nr:hypothetical protein [Candidatus Manganitrophus morganii]